MSPDTFKSPHPTLATAGGVGGPGFLMFAHWMDWHLWDSAYVLIGIFSIFALIYAGIGYIRWLIEGLKHFRSNPPEWTPFVKRNLIPFVVGVAVTLVAAAIISSIFYWRGGSGATSTTASADITQPALKQVFHKAFKDQVVPLDGFDYVQCTFENVTFTYNGGNFKLTEISTNVQKIGLATNNPIVQNTLALVRMMANGKVAWVIQSQTDPLPVPKDFLPPDPPAIPQPNNDSIVSSTKSKAKK